MKAQRGMSLISMMIGLAISMLSILAMLSLYRNIVQNAVVATRSANLDGQIAAGLLSAQLELQSAGFGIEDANGADLMLATIDLSDNSPALLWRLLEENNYLCRGLLDRGVTEAATGQSMRVLSLLQASDCDASGNLADRNWAVVSDLVEFRRQSASQIGFEIDSRICWPFGANGSNSTSHAQVTLSAPSSSQLAGASADPITYSICLPNVRP